MCGVGYLEVCQTELSRRLKSPLNHIPEEGSLACMFLRIWRISAVRGCTWMSVEDLFPLYFPILSMIETKSISEARPLLEVVSEAFLCLSTALELSQRQGVTAGASISDSCLHALRPLALKWIRAAEVPLLRRRLRSEVHCLGSDTD